MQNHLQTICKELFVVDPSNPLYQLAKAIQTLQTQSPTVQVEFVLPDEG